MSVVFLSVLYIIITMIYANRINFVLSNCIDIHQSVLVFYPYLDGTPTNGGKINIVTDDVLSLEVDHRQT